MLFTQNNAPSFGIRIYEDYTDWSFQKRKEMTLRLLGDLKEWKEKTRANLKKSIALRNAMEFEVVKLNSALDSIVLYRWSCYFPYALIIDRYCRGETSAHFDTRKCSIGRV